MATSRTGTARWKRVRRAAITEARSAGVVACPVCLVQLDYLTPYLPASAEVDHVVPVSMGGQDHAENVRVICRSCNVRRGSRPPVLATAPDTYPLSRRW